MGKRNRVVITGMGILAPNGIGIEPFGKSILAGRSGIGRSRYSMRGLQSCMLAK